MHAVAKKSPVTTMRSPASVKIRRYAFIRAGPARAEYLIMM
jgi:hypothetical protein